MKHGRRWVLALSVWCFLILQACGQEPGTADVALALRLHQLTCEIPGLQAKLQVTGGVECPLEVNTDRTVEGICSVEAGEIKEFRLVYFVLLLAPDPNPPLELATARDSLDLIQPTSEQVSLSFPQSSLSTNIDDDRDQLTNLQEICGLTNPRG